MDDLICRNAVINIIACCGFCFKEEVVAAVNDSAGHIAGFYGNSSAACGLHCAGENR